MTSTCAWYTGLELLFFGASLIAWPLVVYVSALAPAGGNGSRHRPYASVEAALERVRATPHASAKIELEPGTLYVDRAISITPAELFGPLTIESSDPKRPAVIDGGRPITGWKVQPNGWWTVRLPKDWNFEELFVNGQRRFRPRLPRRGFYTIADAVAPTDAAKGKGYDRFAFSGSDINPSWVNRDDVELFLFQIWDVTVGRIASVDKNVVTLKSPTCSADGWASLPKGNRFFAENVKEAFGQPGDWYLDRPSGVLTYIPMPGERPERSTVVAPAAEALLEVRGSGGQTPALHVRLANIAFQHTLWNIPVSGRSCPQAEADLGGAITIDNAADVVIDRCLIRQVGQYGIEIGSGCRSVRVMNDTLTDLGAGGVKIGTPYIPPHPSDNTTDCYVVNSQIVGYGRRAPAAVGVWIGQSFGNVVGNDTIEDGYYTGVSAGWTWGYGPSNSNHNRIDSNRIGNIGQGLLSDMGGIYTLGTQPGTQLTFNFIHDVSSYSYGGWGIYPDEGSSDLKIQFNVVTRCKSAGFHQHYGKDNLVDHNLFAFNGEAELMRTRAENHRSFSFTHNIVVWDTGTLLGGNWSGNGFEMDHNLYWRTGGRPIDFEGQSLAQWQAKGFDVHSSVADPLFVDAAHDNYQLRPGSPVDESWFSGNLHAWGSHLPSPPKLPRAWPN